MVLSIDFHFKNNNRIFQLFLCSLSSIDPNTLQALSHVSVVYTNMFKENVRSNRLTAVAFKEKHIKIIKVGSEF